ncbi:MAG: hypothetical protein Q8P67_15745 [archaeon]|nr:hypothetical protein [archaeon]
MDRNADSFRCSSSDSGCALISSLDLFFSSLMCSLAAALRFWCFCIRYSFRFCFFHALRVIPGGGSSRTPPCFWPSPSPSCSFCPISKIPLSSAIPKSQGQERFKQRFSL